VYEKMNGKCFPFFNKRKTLSFRKVTFFNLTRIQFPLTIFLYCCQTWEKQESEFQEFTFLQSNTALSSNFIFSSKVHSNFKI
jgi:hypothetical protein